MTAGQLERYLEGIARGAREHAFEDHYLWPKTPIGHDHQEVIARRVGVSDREVEISFSRPALILGQLDRLIAHGLVTKDFSLLDIACGDGIVLHQIKKAFPRSRCYGMDCNKGQFATHDVITRDGVVLYEGYIQQLLAADPPEPFDLVLMLNTYRGWQSARLREHERDLPEKADAWFRRNARYTIVTATRSQRRRLASSGLNVLRLGGGEDDSEMICLSLNPVPGSLLRYYTVRLAAALEGRGRRERPRGKAPWRRLRRALLWPARKIGRLLRHRLTRRLVWFVGLPAAFLTGRISRRTFVDDLKQIIPRWLRNRQPARDTAFVFVFLGEFGFELLNWQGVVRKLSAHLPKSSEIVIAGRRGLDVFYEHASGYIDISDLARFRESVAETYFALPPYQLRRYNPPSFHELGFDERLRDEIRAHVTERLERTGQAGSGKRLQFVFSSRRTLLAGCDFGVDRFLHWGPGESGSIYRGSFLANNVFRRLVPDLECRAEVEQKLGISLDEPYILMQERRRRIGPQKGLGVQLERLVEKLSQVAKVVFLSFTTGRFMDSESSPAAGANVTIYHVDSFREQGCLIWFAKKCVFTTEGDLGSHTYLPPLMGRDVVVVASQAVFQLPSAPIELWNEHVFRFGGQIIPWVAEEVLRSESSVRDAVRAFVGHGVEKKA